MFWIWTDMSMCEEMASPFCGFRQAWDKAGLQY